MTTKSRILVAAIGFLTATAARAETVDPAEFLRELARRTYTNLDAGIEDLVVDVRDEGIANFPDVGKARPVAKFYWKPDRGLWSVLEGLPPAAEPQLPDIRTYLESQWLRHILVHPIGREFEAYGLVVETRGGDFVLTATAGEAFTESGAQKQVAVFDSNYRVKSRELSMSDGGSIREEYRAGSSKDGRNLIEKLTVSAKNIQGPDGSRGDHEMTLEFDYTQVGGYSFPSRITAAGDGRRASVAFENYKVNEGFDESVYEK